MANQPGLPSEGGKSPAGMSGRDVARIVAVVVLVALLVAFVVDNSQTVKVGFVFFQAHVSLIWALLIAVILGMAIDRLVIYLMGRRRAAKGGPTGKRGAAAP